MEQDIANIIQEIYSPDQCRTINISESIFHKDNLNIDYDNIIKLNKDLYDALKKSSNKYIKTMDLDKQYNRNADRIKRKKNRGKVTYIEYSYINYDELIDHSIYDIFLSIVKPFDINVTKKEKTEEYLCAEGSLTKYGNIDFKISLSVDDDECKMSFHLK